MTGERERYIEGNEITITRENEMERKGERASARKRERKRERELYIERV